MKFTVPSRGSPRAAPTVSTARGWPHRATHYHNFAVPQRVRRADGLPVPFRPTDPEHLEAFPASDPDADEAAAIYQACALAESITNAALSLYHQRDELDKVGLDQRLAWLAVATRLHYRITAARYDYLHAAKDEPGLAELYRATDAVPRNVGRGPGWRKFVETVAVDEAKAYTKKAAEWHVNGTTKRRRRGRGGGGNTLKPGAPPAAAAGPSGGGGGGSNKPGPGGGGGKKGGDRGGGAKA